MIELLVAMAVLALLIVMLMGLVDSTTKLWRQNENRVDAYREARAALGIISRDLDNIVSTDNTNYFALNRIQVPGAVGDTNRASTLFFLTGLPKSAQSFVGSDQNKTDICTVGYFLADAILPGAVDSKRAQRTRNLYRYFLASDQTFTNLSQTNMFQGVSPSSVESELLARNITEFSVEAYTNASANAWGKFSQSMDSPIPKLIKITIKAVNNETAQKLENSDWSDTNAASIKQAVQTFQTHVTIPDPQ